MAREVRDYEFICSSAHQVAELGWLHHPVKGVSTCKGLLAGFFWADTSLCIHGGERMECGHLK